VKFDQQGVPFTIYFPNGQPMQEATKSLVGDEDVGAMLQDSGLAPKVRRWSKEDGGRKYVVAVTEMPTGAGLLDGINDILKDLPEGKIAPKEPESKPAEESIVTRGANKITVSRKLTVRGVTFSIRVEGPADLTLTDENVRAFFDSFRERVPAAAVVPQKK